MGIVIGIDAGGSTTKIVGIKDGEILNPFFVKANDPITSLLGAFGKYTYSNNIDIKDIEKVMITGVGSAYINQPISGLPTGKVDEFIANGIGGKYLTGLDKAVVVSMGTGTSLVKVDGDDINHIGGIGIGGGTIIGLSKLLLDTEDIDEIIELARKGDLEKIDLQIKDITKEALPDLPLDVTASNFGKVHNYVKKEDIAAGIVNMVLQVIGKSGILSCLNSDIDNFIMIGNLTKLPQCESVFNMLKKMSKVNFIIPKYSEYTTAIGSAVAYFNGKYEKI